jgi:hypothetical protein
MKKLNIVQKAISAPYVNNVIYMEKYGILHIKNRKIIIA